MELVTLGSLRWGDEAFTRPKPLLLLSYLSLEGSQSRRTLAELFFPSTKDPRDSLSTAIRQLTMFDPRLLQLENDRVASKVPSDASRLLEKLDAGLLHPATEAYTGPFLQGLDLELDPELEEWVFATREYIEGRVRVAYLRLAEARLHAGDASEASRLAETAYEISEPEVIPADHLRTLFSLLQVGSSPYAARLEGVARELGIDLEDPSPRYDALEYDEQSQPAATPNLPSAGTSFVGRASERMELAQLLGSPDCRLVTLHGPGGIGKSRLALRCAEDQWLTRGYPSGVHWVPLEHVPEPAGIPEAIAWALSKTLTGEGSPMEQLAALIGQDRSLIVLDNFDHLVEGAPLVASLLDACKRLDIVVTSRRRLHIQSEHTLSLEGLEFPSHQTPIDDWGKSDAIRLLFERAKKVKIDFELRPADLEHAAAICRSLGGSPLGIELAMSWARHLPIDRIRAEIDRDQDFLASHDRDAPSRHTNLRTVFDRSWDLLEDRERAIFPRLSIFRGGFRREAASAVADATLPVLVRLDDASLIRMDRHGRYDLHPNVRQYAEERLAADPAAQAETHRRYIDHFTRNSSELTKRFYTSEEPSALAELRGDVANVVSAWWMALEDGDRWAKAMPLNLVVFFDRAGRYQEGVRLFEKAGRALERVPNEDADARAQLYANLAWLYYRLGSREQARTHAERAEDLGTRTSTARMMALNILGLALHAEGREDDAIPRYEEAIALADDRGDSYRAAMYRVNLASARADLGQYDSAVADLDRVTSVAREADYPYMLALAQNNRATIAQDQDDDIDGALELYAYALEVATHNGYRSLCARIYANMAEAEVDRDNASEAERLLEQAHGSVEDSGEASLQAQLLDVRGQLLMRMGGQTRAAEDALRRGLELARRNLQDNRHLKIQSNLCRLWLENERYGDAIPVLRELVRVAIVPSGLSRAVEELVAAVPADLRERLERRNGDNLS